MPEIDKKISLNSKTEITQMLIFLYLHKLKLWVQILSIELKYEEKLHKLTVPHCAFTRHISAKMGNSG